ncbi:MAG: helicase-related protein [Vicinamibacterales bacterium]
MNQAEIVLRTRRRLGLTQAALAARLGVSFVTVNRWENGKSTPPAAVLFKLKQLETGAANLLSSAETNEPAQVDFLGNPDHVRLLMEAERLSYGHAASPTFATETSLIEPLPHQRLAVYEHMLTQPRLRFLLADDAGAGKTIMAGLYIREMLSRRLIRRMLIVPPAGLIGNWQRELSRLFGLRFEIVRGADAKSENPFAGEASDAVICSLDTLSGAQMFARLQDPTTEPYDLVIFDEAHKLSASRDADLTVEKTDRYRLAEALAGVVVADPHWMLHWSARHLLLLTATPHMGKDFPYFALWRLLEPEVLATEEAFKAFPIEERQKRFIRRTKEEMVYFDGRPLYPQRVSDTLGFDLTSGPKGEQELYDRTTTYMRTFYNRAGILNPSAARLALGVFQRRLASSTYAVMRSFERRLERLDEVIARVREGRLTPQELQAAQLRLFDPFDESTADEEAASNGREGHEAGEQRVIDLIRTTSLVELEEERREVLILLDLARAVLASGQESKFEKLREFLLTPAYRGEKLIVFTEHRDTLDWLRRRLEGMGFTDEIAAIHGGMDFRDRDTEVERFKRPTEEGGARYLLATDAAGEGINLQFCWLMVNYDVPWNPARLEQRMGRIHRFGQKHDPVIIANLVANNTREGLVIGTLLRKLEAIRRELRSDKVFDVVGRIFENISITSYLADALIQDNAEQAVARLEGRLTREQVDSVRQRDALLFGDGGDVKRELPRLREVTEAETLRRLLPGYVRQFIEAAAPALGFRIDGSLDATFSLHPTERRSIDPLWDALEDYPDGARSHFTVYRPKSDEAVFVHPGEPIFERLRSLAGERFSADAQRGASFIDPTASSAYVLLVGEFSLVRGQELVESRLVAVRIDTTGKPESCPVEHLLILRGADRFPVDHAALARRATDMETTGSEFVRSQIAGPLLADRQTELRRTEPERERFLSLGFDFQGAELAASRKRLTERARQGNSAAKAALEQVKDQQRALDQRRAVALANLRSEPNELSIGHVTFVARALVVPSASAEERARFDANVEAIAMQVARAFEEAGGAYVQDVSTPPKARAAGLTDCPGFDLLARNPSGETRAIEVKGRARKGDIDVSNNEWARACNLRDGYWLHVVFDCGTPTPRLVRVQDPFARLLTKSGGVIVNHTDILAVGETGWPRRSVPSMLPDVLRPLFWDYTFENLRWPEHRDLVFGRVLQSGTTDAITWLRGSVPDAELADWIRQRSGRGLDARQLRFWQVALNLPETDVDRWVKQAREGAWEARRGA